MILKTLSQKLFKCIDKGVITTPHRTIASIIDGKKIAEDIQVELKRDINAWSQQFKRSPTLVAILVGDDAASATYVAHKMKVAKRVGVESTTEKYPSSFQQSSLLKRLEALNQDSNIDGILVQLPLPKHIDDQLICRSVHPEKDVDGFSALNLGQVALSRDALIPCTPLGVIELLKRSQVQTKGKRAVIVGRSKNVGLPIALLLQNKGCDATTTICHSGTTPTDMKAMCQSADILIVATGYPRTVTGDMVKPGATVIDVGISRISDPQTGKSKLVGDVAFEEVQSIAGKITPVPGGVGPMTVTMLMNNVFQAAQWRQDKSKSPLASLLTYS